MSNRENKRFVGIIVGVVAVFLVITVILNKASVQRTLKSINSEYAGGLDRTVTVYDYDGNEIATYVGKIDVEDTETGGKVKFDLDGKRTIIYGGIVIVQEN
jgi:uncharacterized protein YoxC